MNITVVGAAGGEVTGSCYVVKTARASVLVDCGMFQGGKKSEALNRPPTTPKQRVDAVVLTHGHLDHTGRLPLLTKRGHRMPVFATPATIEMTSLILRDAARIQASDAERQSRKRARAGLEPVEPLYTPDDVEEVLGCLRPVPYKQPVVVAPGVEATWAEAGHMLGSGSILLSIDDGGTRKQVVFSGDLGPRGIPILRDYEPFHRADAVFLESTYGGRDHRPFQETVEEFAALVGRAMESGGKILVPTFAVGRAQLLTGLLAWLFRKQKLRPFPVFLDSPMAIEATRIYARHRELFDDGMTKFISEKPMKADLRTLKICQTAKESMQINEHVGACLVMAGAGMCNAGRILHHLRANLGKPETHVLIVGYQGRGSLGRRLVDGEKVVPVLGDRITVRAQVHTLGGFSAHAGQTDLLAWFGAIAPSKPRVVLTHGEDEPREELARQIRARYRLASEMPAMGDTLEF